MLVVWYYKLSDKQAQGETIMARTGRAVIAQGQDFEIREYPVPEPAPNTILLRQELAGICGTDLHNW